MGGREGADTKLPRRRPRPAAPRSRLCSRGPGSGGAPRGPRVLDRGPNSGGCPGTTPGARGPGRGARGWGAGGGREGRAGTRERLRRGRASAGAALSPAALTRLRGPEHHRRRLTQRPRPAAPGPTRSRRRRPRPDSPSAAPLAAPARAAPAALPAAPPAVPEEAAPPAAGRRRAPRVHPRQSRLPQSAAHRAEARSLFNLVRALAKSSPVLSWRRLLVYVSWPQKLLQTYTIVVLQKGVT